MRCNRQQRYGCSSDRHSEPHNPLPDGYQVLLIWGQTGWTRKLTTLLHVVPRLRMCGIYLCSLTCNHVLKCRNNLMYRVIFEFCNYTALWIVMKTHLRACTSKSPSPTCGLISIRLPNLSIYSWKVLEKQLLHEQVVSELTFRPQ